MKWSVQQLRKLQREGLLIDEVITLNDIKNRNSDIRHISPIEVKGRTDVKSDYISFTLNIKGEMILPCSRSFVDVPYPFSISTTEIFLLTDQKDADGENIHVLENDVVDLTPIIEELILLEIPIQIYSENADDLALTSGNDWQVIDEVVKDEKIDPRLADLAKFFNKK